MIGKELLGKVVEHGLQVSLEKDSAQWKPEIDYQAQIQHGIQDRIQAPS